MKTIRILTILLLVPAIVLVSCKKNEDPTPEYKAPSAANWETVIEVPSGLEAVADTSTLPGPAMAVAAISLANGLSSFAHYFDVPENAEVQNKKGSSVVYHWSYQGYSYWMTYEVLADKYVWTLDYEMPNVPRFTFISAWEGKTSNAGGWVIWNPENDSEKIWEFDWTKAGTILTVNLDMYEGTVVSASFNVSANTSDNSGNFKEYVNSQKVVEVTWLGNGSGTWWYWDGQLSYTGAWTAKK